MTSSLTYNAFGLLTISREKITATLTIIQGETHISRSVIHEVDTPEVEPDELAMATLGARVQTGKQTHLSLHELNELKSRVVFSELSGVRAALDSVTEKIKLASKIE